MINIKFECWWTNSESINKRIIKQFINTKTNDLNNYSLVNNNPDFTIVLGRTDWGRLETAKDKTFYISQEPLWSPNEPKNDIHQYCSKILIADKRYYPDRPEYIECLLPMLYAGRGESDYRSEWDWNNTLLNKTFQKNKPISIVVKKDYFSTYNSLSKPGLSEIIYEKRTKIAEFLSDNNQIDIYGNFWEKNNQNIKGEIWSKHIALDNYYFSLCMENTIQKNYISEKFWDAILVNTIPIYLGCININDYIENSNFIYLNDKSLIEIKDLTNNLLTNYQEEYKNRYNNIVNLRYLFFTDSRFNLWEKVKKIIYEY